MSTRLSQWINRLGLYSLRSRYIAVTTIISFILVLSAVIGWNIVETETTARLHNVQYRADVNDALTITVLKSHVLETQLYRFITLPDKDDHQLIQRTFLLAQNAVQKLRANHWIQHDKTLSGLVHALEQDYIELEKEAVNLITVRSDETKWFPAMKLMQEQMLTHNLQFMSALDLMIQEIGGDLKTPSSLEIYRLLNQTRHYWQLMIGEFRLFVANSFGVFANNPRDGMNSRRANIALYIAHLKKLLSRLQNYNKKGQLDLIGNTSLSEMQQRLTQWQSAYREVSQTLDSNKWRYDLVLLQSNIEPILSRIRQRTSSLQLELNVASAKDITHLTEVARQFSDYVTMLAVAIICTGLLGFMVFHRAILRPIAGIAQALKDEASGHRRSQVPISTAEEIRDLTLAFAEMREQIRTREAHLDHMAHHDALTHLPNRILFHFRLEQAIAAASRGGYQVGLLFLDLDRFKQINDSLGHDIGDLLLQAVAKRLSGCLRSSDTVARLGGDEFGVIVDTVTHTEQLASAARKILKEFKAPFQVGNHELHTSTSIGIALGPRDADKTDSLLKHADIAMYHSKTTGRNTYRFYAQEMSTEIVQQVTLETQLRHAIHNQEFSLYYQPIVELRTGRIISTEALLRWNHPNRGLISPTEFLPVLIDSGLIKPVTQWVLIEAGKQYLRYKAAGYPHIRTSVNLSGFMFRNDALLEIVLAAIEHTGVEPKGLIVEVTEDTLQKDLHGAQQALTTLQKMGIRIALDDFGTGQSSLNHLRHNPIDIVKIDRDFIAQVPIDRADSDLVDAVIAMAHKLHIKVVAEGVETKQQLDFLHWHKCDAIQGYIFSQPLPADEILTMLAEDRRRLG